MSKQPIHTPYHFVPLSRSVMLPKWAHLVSHDVPFKDGLNGTIKVKLQNHSPLLVGGEQSREDGKVGEVKWHTDPTGRPLIPGSSLKGMLRNVVEIASFGKFQQIEDKTFAYRELTRDSTYQKHLNNMRITSAWLKFDPDRQSWQLTPCKFQLVSKPAFDTFANKVGKAEIRKGKTALENYKNWPLTKAHSIRFDTEMKAIYKNGEHTGDKSVAKNLGRGEFTGTPVFIGPKVGIDDDYLYFFYDQDTQSKAIGSELPEKLFASHDPDWVAYLKANGHPNYGMPVFVSTNKTTKKIDALGLAQMPKLPFRDSIHDIRDANQALGSAKAAAGFDLAELIFGTLRDEGMSLKSRVSFTDAKIKQTQIKKLSDPVILASPKPSYMNAYIEQPEADPQGNCGTGDLFGYNGAGSDGRTAQLKGWKRYPASPKTRLVLPTELKDKAKLQSRLELLEKGAEFAFTVHFHNLKPEELGALLWSITLNQNPDLAHSLGYGKPLGLGVIGLTVENLEIKPNIQREDSPSLEDLIALYVDYMQQWHPGQNWQASPQIAHLLSFADWQNNQSENLAYMPLSKSNKNSNAADYVGSIKGDKMSLPDWKALQRKESRNAQEPCYMSFGEGRLSALIDNSEFNKHIIKNKEFEKFEREKLAEEAQRAEIMANAPEYMQSFLNLKERFDTLETSQKDSINADLASNLNEALSADWEKAHAIELHQFVKREDVPYLQIKDKNKRRTREGLVQRLEQKYQLNTET